MRRRLSCSLALSALGALAFAGAARADMTIGSTTFDPSATSHTCQSGVVVAQVTNDPSTPYTIPVGGGKITQWQTNTTGSLAGAAVTLVVLQPAGAGSYRIVGADARTLPSPLASGQVVSFTLSTPIAVTGGETLGLYTNGSPANCFYSSSSIPTGNALGALNEPSPPAAGQTVVQGGVGSPGGFAMDVAVTFRPDHDAAVAATASPANATVGSLALLASSVSNVHGAGTDPITFTDTVPAGLTVNSAAAGSGTCATSGQQVTCTISGLAQGKTAPVNIIVTPTAPKSYANAVSVAVGAGTTDPNPGNNTAAATLAVGAAPAAPKCVVPSLKRTPQSVAKSVLTSLGCKVGKTKRGRSKSIAKGSVIGTSPKAGTYAVGTTVDVTVSSGPKKKKHKK